MRCVPQVHGVVHDTIKFVTTIITTEMNGATDNPVREGWGRGRKRGLGEWGRSHDPVRGGG